MCHSLWGGQIITPKQLPQNGFTQGYDMFSKMAQWPNQPINPQNEGEVLYVEEGG